MADDGGDGIHISPARSSLTGTGEKFDFQVGSNKGAENVISFELESDTQSDSVGIEGLDITDQDNAQDSLAEIDAAVMTVAGVRAKLGAVQSRFNYAIDNLDVQRQNIDEARSIIADVDVAEETSKLARAQVLQEAGMAVLAQANSHPKKLLQLIG